MIVYAMVQRVVPQGIFILKISCKNEVHSMRRKLETDNLEEIQICLPKSADVSNWGAEETMIRNAAREVPGGIIIYEIKNGRINIHYHNKEILELFGFEEKDVLDRRSFFVRELVDLRDIKKLQQSLSERENPKRTFPVSFASQTRRGAIGGSVFGKEWWRAAESTCILQLCWI